MPWKKGHRGWFYITTLLIVFNLFDAFFTLRFNELKLATEINPIMDYFLKIDPSLFFWVKFLLVATSAIFLYANRNIPLARYALCGGVLLYLFINMIHIYGFIFLEGGFI